MIVYGYYIFLSSLWYNLLYIIFALCLQEKQPTKQTNQTKKYFPDFTAINSGKRLNNASMNQDLRADSTQSLIECSKLTIQTLEEGVKYVQS